MFKFNIHYVLVIILIGYVRDCSSHNIFKMGHQFIDCFDISINTYHLNQRYRHTEHQLFCYPYRRWRQVDG